MTEEQYSFEEIDRGIDALDFGEAEAALKAGPEDVRGKVCEVYKAVRPILVALSNFPLIPKKWRTAIKVFIRLMDALCG